MDKPHDPFSHIPELSFILNELGEDRQSYFNAVAPPIMQTSNFAFQTVAELRAAFKDEMGGYLYSRGLNPTTDILRKKLAALDGAEDGLVFANGAAAIFAGVLVKILTDNGQHINWWVRNAKHIEHIQRRRHNPQYLSSAYLDAALLSLAPSLQNGQAVRRGDRISLTDTGMLAADGIAASLFQISGVK